jgi:hypothetical protein
MEENVRTCTRLGWKGHTAHSHVVLGTLALAAFDIREARQHLAAARTWCADSGEVEMILRALILEARIALAEPDHDAACMLATRARELIEVWGFGAFVEDLAPFSIQ